MMNDDDDDDDGMMSLLEISFLSAFFSTSSSSSSSKKEREATTNNNNSNNNNNQKSRQEENNSLPEFLMHICNGCWAEIENEAYITRCGHQFCAAGLLLAFSRARVSHSLTLSLSLSFAYFKNDFVFSRLSRAFLYAVNTTSQVKRTYRECCEPASVQSVKRQCSNDT